MRAFLSKILLSIFIAVFAIPSSLLAQTNWVGPNGGPTEPGTNTPAPLNVSDAPQTKTGGLEVKGDFLLSGTTGSTPAKQFFSFTPSYFFNGLNVGSGFTGSQLNVLGKFQYTPAAVGGQPAGPAPVANSVLKSADAQGNIVWGAAMPDGVNTGDTLIWNETCNCWETEPGGGSGPGVGPGGSFPDGTEGQTLWFNSATGQWEATSMIERFVLGNDQFRRTRLRDPHVNIMGPSINFGNNNSLISGVDPSSSLYGFNVSTRTTRIGSNNVEIGVSNTSPSSYTSGQPNKTDILSNNVNFFSTSGNAQNVTFESSSVKFKGPATDPALLDAGIGRIPYSTDEEGTFKWAKDLYYNTFPNFLNAGVTLNAFRLDRPEYPIGGSTSTTSVFVNEGLTLLNDNTSISGKTTMFNDLSLESGGDIYLDDVEISMLGGDEENLVELCWHQISKKVVRCETNNITGVGNDPTANPIELTFTNIMTEHMFDDIVVPTEVAISYCGGGGGGGGGGRGIRRDVHDEQSNTYEQFPGIGGGGGGGGGRGQCLQTNILVNPGDVLQFFAGSGGSGGHPAEGSDESQGFATDGEYGSTSVIKKDGVIIAPIAMGGHGGRLGESANIDSSNMYATPLGGDGGSLGEPLPWWNNGHNGGNPNTTACTSCGGPGGAGERWPTQTPPEDVYNAPLNGPSTGGRGGVWGASYGFMYGGAGTNGGGANGGGGGGGGYGFYQTVDDVYKGGRGGDGGSGYVTINYNSIDPNQNSSNSWVVNTPGESLYSLQEIKAANMGILPHTLTVELWSGGGGGSGVEYGTNTPLTRGGGGGSGSYKSMQYSIPQDLYQVCMINSSPQPTCNLLITIGAGGTLGNSTGGGLFSGSVSGGDGGYTKVHSYGNPGNSWIISGSDSATGLPTNGIVRGGVGAEDNMNPGSGTASAGSPSPIGSGIHNPGQTGSNGGMGGASVNNGFGAGGWGANIQTVGGVMLQNAIPATPGQNGAVRISW